MQPLDRLGWNDAWAAALAAAASENGEDLSPARVVLEHGRFYRLEDGSGERLAVTAGRLRHGAANAADLPAVGDWVGFRPGAGDDLAQIRAVLPRATKFSRKGAGVRTVEQVVAANIDTVFLMMGLDGDFNVRRLERYLAVAWGSGARPVIVLNKMDLVDAAALDARRAELAALAPNVPIAALAIAPAGEAAAGAPDELGPWLVPRATVALLGSSGVGKSTLLNRLAGAALQRTNVVRAYDSRGRHTTTHAQLFALPTGALCIDTPGMRALSLWENDEGLETAFDDVEAVAARCRFRDCRHVEEPGCAVRAGLETGELSQARYDSFQKLHAEVDALQKDPWARRKRKQGEKIASKALKKVTQED